MNVSSLDFESFLSQCRISKEEFEKTGIKFEDLKKIGEKHENSSDDLNKTAEFIASTLQRMPEVHSVRWRVKDPIHLMEKIIRKINDNSKKYIAINEENYDQIVTDLIGVRVLHLFKHEWEGIHEKIISLWHLKEVPVAYTRSGDEKELTDKYKSKKCKVDVHSDGYRSIHYIIQSQATKMKTFCELQVRTIFEEGWSEIDHKIRYPNFSDNEMICYFLKVFNRLAGSADEMGTFINLLSDNVKQVESVIEQKEAEKREHLKKIDDLMEKLSQHESRDENTTSEKIISELQQEIANLKRSESLRAGVNMGLTAARIAGVGPAVEALRSAVAATQGINGAGISAFLKSAHTTRETDNPLMLAAKNMAKIAKQKAATPKSVSKSLEVDLVPEEDNSDNERAE